MGAGNLGGAYMILRGNVKVEDRTTFLWTLVWGLVFILLLTDESLVCFG